MNGLSQRTLTSYQQLNTRTCTKGGVQTIQSFKQGLMYPNDVQACMKFIANQQNQNQQQDIKTWNVQVELLYK